MPIIELLCSEINISVHFHVPGIFFSIILNDLDALDLDIYMIPFTSWCIWFLRVTRIANEDPAICFFLFLCYKKGSLETSFDL